LKVLLIDFYDSFTYNIFHYLESLGADVTVWEDCKVEIDLVAQFDCIVFSPGPGLPKDTKSLFPVLKQYEKSKKILGVCLGMQGIAEFYGAKLYNQKEVKHGVSEKMSCLNKSKLFLNLPKEFEVGLYHSWAIELIEDLEIIPIGISENKVIMAIEHVKLPIYGVQFHPESILTPFGKDILRNFLFSC
jgi:anthranilate synthase component 2